MLSIKSIHHFSVILVAFCTHLKSIMINGLNPLISVHLRIILPQDVREFLELFNKNNWCIIAILSATVCLVNTLIIASEGANHFIQYAVAYCRMTWVLNRIGLWVVMRG